ncbi:hypothetical protein [Bacillus sp. B15-48]|nr:hypothetical protein [Bacillus sp. B15-48]
MSEEFLKTLTVISGIAFLIGAGIFTFVAIQDLKRTQAPNIVIP